MEGCLEGEMAGLRSPQASHGPGVQPLSPPHSRRSGHVISSVGYSTSSVPSWKKGWINSTGLLNNCSIFVCASILQYVTFWPLNHGCGIRNHARERWYGSGKFQIPQHFCLGASWHLVQHLSCPVFMSPRAGMGSKGKLQSSTFVITWIFKTIFLMRNYIWPQFDFIYSFFLFSLPFNP